jgi:hypothetical protein
MDRRRFLGLLGLAAPTYFFAPRGGWLKTGSVWMPSLTDGLPFYRDIQLIAPFGINSHLVATGKLLTDLGEVVGVVRKAWPTLETDASLRQRMIMVMETMQV